MTSSFLELELGDTTLGQVETTKDLPISFRFISISFFLSLPHLLFACELLIVTVFTVAIHGVKIIHSCGRLFSKSRD